MNTQPAPNDLLAASLAGRLGRGDPTAADNHAPDRLIKHTAGHSSVETLEGYIRDANIRKKNSARYLELDR